MAPPAGPASNIESQADVLASYDPSKNTSRPVMSRFELTKVIGQRLEQLARGAEPQVDVQGLKTLRDIALKELELRKLPFMIARTMPNGTREYWRLADLTCTHASLS